MRPRRRWRMPSGRLPPAGACSIRELVAVAVETGATPLTERETDVLRAAVSGRRPKRLDLSFISHQPRSAITCPTPSQTRRAESHGRDPVRGRGGLAVSHSSGAPAAIDSNWPTDKDR